jgi:uncharacterized membrane protein SirB2
MTEHYQTLKALHIGCVLGSGGLFLLRYVLTALKLNWRKSLALRVMPHIVDSILLISAVLLCIAIQQYPIVNAWLTVKVVALLAYIGVGMMALKPSNSLATRRITFIVAATLFIFIVSVARAHHPLGILARFFS